MEEENYFMGVDVGTGSSRCAIFDQKGNKICYSQRPIKTWNYEEIYFEQSTEGNQKKNQKKKN